MADGQVHLLCILRVLSTLSLLYPAVKYALSRNFNLTRRSAA
jgi:hypothetical protein